MKRTRALERPPAALDYNSLKAQWEAVIVPWARRSFPAIVSRVRIALVWCERTKHRDPDGVSSGGRKLLLDGLVKAGRLTGDGAAQIGGFTDSFFWDADEEGVKVEMISGVLGIVGSAFFPYRLPDLNELLAARELGARRQQRRQLRGRLA
jgi:hypothetical protein